MRYKITLIVFFLLVLSVSTFAQGDFQKHTVLKGETVSSIARKYGVSVSELLKLNPNTENVLYEDQEILIPTSQDSSSATNAGTSSNQTGNGDVIYHTVQAGETKFGLARRYSVSIEKLDSENPHIVRSLQVGHKLKITGGKDLFPHFSQFLYGNSTTSYAKTISYVVLPNETLWGISHRNGLTVDELVSANRDALTGVLRSGQTINIPIKDANGVSTSAQTGESYVVQPGDTKFSLARRFGISVSEMEQLNPQIVAILQAGHVLVLPSDKSGSAQKTPPVSKPIESQVTTPQNTTVVSNPTAAEAKYKTYEVQPKQTLFGLAKMAGISQNQLIELNPDLTNGVRTGMVIRIPISTVVPDSAPVITAPSVVQGKLFNSLNKLEKKKIAFLYPVNESDFASWVNAPKVLTTKEKPELKRATDFYLGAQMAMDSLRKLGVQIEDIKIASSLNSILSVAKQKELDKQSLVFYPSNDATAEKVEEYLNINNVPLLSFFDDTSSKRETNAFIMLPGELQLKILMFEYMKNQGGRIIAIVDPSRKESLAFIKANYPNVVFAQMDKKGIVDVNSIKNALDKSQKNFVVLDSDKVGLILDVTTFLMQESTNYSLQLALVEPKDAIENENLSEMRFVVLKMLYPSAALNDKNALVTSFKTNFNKKYNSLPTTEAIQGFDCTFDALLRLYQTQSFETIAKDEETKQLLYRFKYTKSQAGAYNNIGGYILQFDTNTDSKIVN